MTEMNQEERDEILEAREIEKEEKRRAEEQARLIKYRREKRMAMYQSVRFGLLKTKSFFSKISNVLSTIRKYFYKVHIVIKAFCKKTDASSELLIDKVWTALSVFAKTRISIPILFILSISTYVGIICFSGFKLFELKVHPAMMQFYICDFSVGYCSRLFVGAVIALFAEKVSIAQMNLIINWSVCITLLCQSLLICFLLRAAMKNRSLPAAMMAFFFLVNPLCVTENMSAPGLLDVYLLLLFFIWLCFIKTPIVSIVTPIVCVIGMSIHYEFLFTFLPPILSLLLYDALLANKRRVRVEKTFALVGGSVVSALAFIYFVFFSKDHLKMTSSEFYQYMLSRLNMTSFESEGYTNVMGAPFYRDYFDYYIFGEYQGKNYFNNMGDFFTFLRNWTASKFNGKLFRNDMLLFMPVLCVASSIWLRCASREKGIRKLPYYCFIAQSLVLIPELIISTDIWRWVSAALLSQLIVFAVVYLDKDALVHRVLDQTKPKCISNLSAILGMAVFVSVCFVIK